MMFTVKRKYIAYLLGLGLTLFAVHNPYQPAIEYAFLPTVGFALVIISICFVFANQDKWLNLGPKYIYIPLMVIAASVVLQAAVSGWQWSQLVFGLLLVPLYITARHLGKEIFYAFIPIVIVEALSCVIYGVIYPGVKTGGLVSPTNYDMAAGVLIFGTLVSAFVGQWWLAAIAIVGLFFTGADEGLFAMLILVVVLVARRDWSLKLLLPIGAIVLTVGICMPVGITRSLYFPSVQKLAIAKEAVEDTAIGNAIDRVIPDQLLSPVFNVTNPIGESAVQGMGTTNEMLHKATNKRWLYWKEAITDIKPLGHGLNLTTFYKSIPHNVPLIIMYQVGPVAALAWLWVTIAVCIKTKWKYAFAGVMALSVFDHYLWTQVHLWWWALVGVASVSNIKSDLIFKEAKKL